MRFWCPQITQITNMGALRGIALGVVAVLSARAFAADEDVLAGDPQAEAIAFGIPGSAPKAESRAIVIVPRSYLEKPRRLAAGSTRPIDAEVTERRYPAVYLLHGYSGNCTDWYKRTKERNVSLGALADRFGVILVLPDGKFSSWYLDAMQEGEDSADWQWETVMTKRLVPEIDRRYRTWAEPAGRGIAGLSMGGHGALYLAARHPELFSACGGMSGVMDLTNTSARYDLSKRLGPFEENKERWVEHSVLTQAEKFAGRKVGVMIDCGIEDRFYPDHKALHAKLLELKVPHDSVERPGGHTWDYWVNALPYHLQFLGDRLKPAGPPKQAGAAFPAFEQVVVDGKLPDDPYGIDIVDMNGDGKLDILLVRFSEVVWYESPAWAKHVIVGDATRQNVYGAAHDCDGDGRLDLALGWDWQFNNTASGGMLGFAQGQKEAGSAWPVRKLLEEPTIHRVRWADTDGDGTRELIVIPLKGRDTTGPDFAERGVRILGLRAPSKPAQEAWRLEVIDDSLHVSHNLQAVQFDGDPAQELLAVSFEGVTLLDRGPDGAWTTRRLCGGEQNTSPNRGSSEVAFGKLADGTRLIATIEPWHGHEVVVYLEPKDPTALWTRFMLDDSLDQGHGIGCGDFDGDGDDEIVAGYRGANASGGEPTSLKAYDAVDPATGKWAVHWLDRGNMATEDLRVVDIDADGRLDIVAAGRATRNVKVYLNRP